MIVLMIGRKLILINDKNEYHNHTIREEFLSEIFDFNKIKYSIIKNSKKIGHVIIWFSLKFYIISLNFLTKKIKGIIVKIKNRINKNNVNNVKEKKEVSKYLKMIYEYKQKIRNIKQRIEKEEGIE